MKVLQINTVCSFGSTGSNAVELAEGLSKYGVETRVAYGQKSSDFKDSYCFSFYIENKIHSLLSRLTGLQGVYSYFGTKRLIKYIKKFHPDVVHINNLHGNYLNIPDLFRFLSEHNYPVVYTIHDCWAYTGNCAHYVVNGCMKWKDKCNKCPQKSLYPPSLIDNSDIMFSVKRNAYSRLKNLTLIPVSKWISKELSVSMLSFADIKMIYNWVDTEIFNSEKNREVLLQYGIDYNTRYVLGVCGRWSKLKGINDWIKLAELLDNELKIVLIGKHNQISIPNSVKDRFILIPYVSNQEHLATFYCSAEAFLNLSSEESFGKTTAEALSCGCPVIVYNTTACPELVGDNCGFVADLNDVHSVSNCIKKILTNSRDEYKRNCRAFALENFNKEKNIEKYYSVYKESILKSK